MASGTRLGPYEVQSAIGKGGMGEVYKALDTRLGRMVAIKVLPDAVASDAERLARFDREAKTLAALNHPNIAAIYGLEKSDDTTALVMELVEGPTLADRIAHGPIPVDDTLAIARQIAEALEAAHEHGIVHRDLKPANVKVRDDGTVKVLDFGLAKPMQPTPASPDVSQSPTITTPAMTQAGLILGTAAYMSPEQARGKLVDRRTDVWAFGCVLYEMLCGRRAFAGEDVPLTLANVLGSEPAFEALPPDVPATVRQALRACLRKDPKQRVRAIGDAWLALDGAFETKPSILGDSPATPALKSWQRPVLASVVIGSASLLSVVMWGAFHPAPPAPSPARFEIPLPESDTLSVAVTDHDLAVSPDGSHVVYRAVRDGRSSLYVRAIGDLVARPLPDLGESAFAPFVSPDGAWVGFSDEADGTLKRVSILGGPPVRIGLTGTGGEGIAGASWSEDGSIVFGPGSSGGLRRMAASGGDAQELTSLTTGETRHAWPEVMPGGRAVLFTILGSGNESARLAVLDLETGRRKVLLSGGSSPRYSPTGHIVYAIDGRLRAVPFDAKRMAIVGTDVPVVDSVVTKDNGAADFALARNGSLVYLSGGPSTQMRNLVWVDRAGREEPVGTPARAYFQARVSPDGARLALDIRSPRTDIWIWEFANQALTPLTLEPSSETFPVWSRDGRRVIFGSTRNGISSLFWQAADGSGTLERLAESPRAQLPLAVTADGTQVIARETGPSGRDLMLMPLEPPRLARPLVQTAFDEDNADLDPGGRWLAYESNESGRLEIYVRRFPGVDEGKWQVSIDGGRMPVWSRSGEELFYVSPDGALMVVRSQPGSLWRLGVPTRVLTTPYYYPAPGVLGRPFDIAPDGRRFLMIKEETADRTAGTRNRMIFVQHWDQELERLVPAR